jgi:Ion channel
MLLKLFIAWFLLALTVVIHAAGLAAVSRRLLGTSQTLDTRFWPVTSLIVQVAWQLIVLHVVEIALWALFFWWQKCLPDMESSFYFSGVTYATVGYGDLVLPMEWRLFGPIEGLTGILMCGLSVSFFFAIVSKVFRVHTTTEKN